MTTEVYDGYVEREVVLPRGRLTIEMTTVNREDLIMAPGIDAVHYEMTIKDAAGTVLARFPNLTPRGRK